MSLSKTAVANMALYALKNSKTVTDIDSDTSAQGVILNTFFEIALRITLAKNDWSFARKIAALSNVADAPNDEWDGSWRSPSDMVKALYIVTGQRTFSRNSPEVPFEIGVDVTGGLIFCDYISTDTAPNLKYTFYQSTVSLWKPRFALAFSYKWAELAARTLTGGDPQGLEQKCVMDYEREILAAIAEDQNSGQRDLPRESEFIEGRG
jgi:hypothetical protein